MRTDEQFFCTREADLAVRAGECNQGAKHVELGLKEFKTVLPFVFKTRVLS